MKSKKDDTNELKKKTEIELQMQKPIVYSYQGGKGRRGITGTDAHTTLYKTGNGTIFTI